MTDGIYITKPAMNKLARNLKLKVKNNVEGVCKNAPKPSLARDTRQYTPAPHTPHQEGWTEVRRRKGRNNNLSAAIYYDNTHTYSSERYDTLRSTRRCIYCAETGHTEENCRHGQPVQCHNCQYTGHKSKFCDYSR